MPSTYYTRSAPPPSPEAALDSFSDLDRDFEATSTIGRSSSPPYLSDDEETLRQHRIQQRVNVTQLAGPLQSDSDDDETGERMSPTEKTLTILKLMRKKCPRFSLRSFILELFTSDNGDLKAAVGNFVRDGGVFQLMEVFWELSTHWQRGKFDPPGSQTAQAKVRIMQQRTAFASLLRTLRSTWYATSNSRSSRSCTTTPFRTSSTFSGPL
ncbi:hypothetical protein PsYK624_074510 [Phanerochaete sordida]|uniref:Uncharacterized protein n=1 Tax=Phanerochaete sordida TaxID=48140 RepID=A0A9P3LES7_9APHY|nr:hypothetical protein PsYK624_074510 [Phanerochaete sordida]